ncbi:MAG: PilC/PilY family type IV pilus protein [Xanthomonadales bacterium]|nr:PilC/PilY family type IV pilus protein [Xanthomonadales bacterium]
MNTMTKLPITLLAMAVAFAAGLLTPVTSWAALLLPNVPLFVNISTTPNIFLQMDDSGSMDWDILMPTHFTTCRYNKKKNCTTLESTGELYDYSGEKDDSNRWIYETFEYVEASNDDAYSTDCSGSSRQVIELCGSRPSNVPWDWRVKSSSLNVMFFNPNIDYYPWVGYSNASFGSARSWPDSSQSSGYNDTENLNGFVYNHWIDNKGFSGSRPDMTDHTNSSNGIVDEWDSYVEVTVNSSGFNCVLKTASPNSNGLNLTSTGLAAGSTQCLAALGANGNLAQLQQNVVNWFQYYRRRNMVARAAIARTVTGLPSFRYGFSTINDGMFVQMPPPDTYDFTTHNNSLINQYIDHRQAALSTPLRRGLERVGLYYADELSGKPSPITTACQKNFTILFSDGFWNGSDPIQVSGDVDGDGGSLSDGENTLLADVSKYYYDKDLSDKPNLVPTDQFDPASHQHMVTFTVGFGIIGSLYDDDGDGWPDNLNNGSKWYTSGSTDNERRVDDLWHAAWNSKGQYISAKRPEELINKLTGAILDISDRVGGAASGATNGGSITSESKVFQAKFDALDWHGSLLAISVDSSNGELDQIAWEAGALLDQKSNSFFSGTRQVYSYNPASDSGTTFTWSGLSTAQKALMNINPETGATDTRGAERVNYIRGVDTGEGTTYRQRQHILGDISHSDPQYVGVPPFFYPFDDYASFARGAQNRPAMIYVGANDGMLHAFRESDGVEVYAYVPNEVLHKLPKLTSRYYGHEFYVDGSPAYGDIQISNSWKSILVSGLRSGGQGIFALDVTDPENFGTSNVLWEFTDEDDPDLGYYFGEPQIKKMQNGKWAAIFTSGYNNTVADGNTSSTGKQYVYIVFIEDGLNGWSSSDFRKIELPGADGLSSPAVTDVDGDSLADYIYVGDLDGNMWKIDVTSETKANWNVAFSGEPLFIAKDEDGTRQPITTRPAIMRHPLSIREGVMVIFGTGKYLEVNDDVTEDVPPQSVYGIWDRDGYYFKPQNLRNSYGAHDFNRDDLSNPMITVDTTTNRRIIHDNEANLVRWFDEDGDPDNRGWVIDLPVQGERVNRNVILRDNIAFLVTLIPEEDVCAAGGKGWLMALNAETGNAPRFPVLDMTDDNIIDKNDVLTRDNPYIEGEDSSLVNPVGLEMLSIPNLPTLLYDDRASDLGSLFPPRANAPRGCGAAGAKSFTYTTRTNGSIEMVAAAHQPLSCGRQSWDQAH